MFGRENTGGEKEEVEFEKKNGQKINCIAVHHAMCIPVLHVAASVYK